MSGASNASLAMSLSSQEVVSTSVEVGSSGTLMAVATGFLNLTGSSTQGVSCQLYLGGSPNSNSTIDAMVTPTAPQEPLSSASSWTSLSPGNYTVSWHCVSYYSPTAVSLENANLNVWGG